MSTSEPKGTPTFDPITIQTFMGGSFKLPSDMTMTVGGLKRVFAEWQKELDGWGMDAHPLTEAVIMRDEIKVTMQKGITL